MLKKQNSSLQEIDMNVLLQTEIAEALPGWVDSKEEGFRLLASRETATGKHYFPPIPPSSPLAARYESVRLSEHATLYSYTIIHPNKKANKPPFALVYADFPENVRVFGRYHPPAGQRPAIGQRLSVALSLDDLGALHYSFKPA
jgi:uncharacterized OB-fold protein